MAYLAQLIKTSYIKHKFNNQLCFYLANPQTVCFGTIRTKSRHLHFKKMCNSNSTFCKAAKCMYKPVVSAVKRWLGPRNMAIRWIGSPKLIRFTIRRAALACLCLSEY